MALRRGDAPIPPARHDCTHSAMPNDQEQGNLFRYDLGTRAIAQLTFHADFDARSLTSGVGRLTYEQGGRLHVYDPDNGQARTLSIQIAADLPYTRLHYQKAAPWIENCGVSSTGLSCAAWPRRCASVVEDRQVELAQTRGVGEHVDCDDLVAPDREAHDRKRPSIWKPRNDTRGSIHEHPLYELGTP
jgi:hypothetical protein